MDYEQSVKMHEYVTKTLGQKSIIVDADDLQADPGEFTITEGHSR